MRRKQNREREQSRAAVKSLRQVHHGSNLGRRQSQPGSFFCIRNYYRERRSQMLRTPKELPKRLCCVVLLDKRERKGRNSDDREHWERWEQSGVVSFSKLKVIKLKWEWFCGGLFCVCMLWKDESERATIIQLNSGWVWGCFAGFSNIPSHSR